MINIRAKGANGEREISDALNYIVYSAMKEFGLPPIINSIQRNQNQSAGGGGDLTGTMGLSIEIKRQEALQINTWWKQCCASADRNNEIPVLIYRQSRKPWYVVINSWLLLPNNAYIQSRCTIEYEQFKVFFTEYVRRKLRDGYIVKI